VEVALGDRRMVAPLAIRPYAITGAGEVVGAARRERARLPTAGQPPHICAGPVVAVILDVGSGDMLLNVSQS
jgi:hypothetical protein